MTVLEKIKQTGGFADFGAVGSMPLGYFANGAFASTAEYHEAMRLKSKGKITVVGRATNVYFKKYLTRELISGDLLK